MTLVDDIQEAGVQFELLLENIERIKEYETIVPFCIVDFKRGGFLVRIEGLYGYVPFNRMPWTYPHPKFWESIQFSLIGKSFFGKVYDIERKEGKADDGKDFFRVYVDASKEIFTEAEINRELEYQGVVVRKLSFGVLVDIGAHFEWKCGSLTGLLHQSKMIGPEALQLPEPGETIAVNYIGENDRGLLFAMAGYSNLQDRYVGKKIQIKVSRNENDKFTFWTIDGHKAYMPLQRAYYGEKKAWTKRALKFLIDGEIIDCEILEVKNINNLFVVKWLPDDEFVSRVDLHLQKIQSFTDKIIPVKVCKSENGELSFLVDDKYKAVISLENYIYKGTENLINYSMNYWSDGDVIDCEILDIDSRDNTYTVKLFYKDIEMLMRQEMMVPFKIVEIKKGGFLAIMKNICVYIPFNLMPWNYPHLKSWEALASQLKEVPFSGKIFRIERTSDNKGISRVFVDATQSPFTEPELCFNMCYKGIVTLKKVWGAFVDIGHHFDWRSGSLQGLLHATKFPSTDSFNLCETGQIIGVRYLGKTEQGLIFEKEDYEDLHTKYVGKTVSVKIGRNCDGALNFTVDDSHKAIMPLTKSIYGEKKDWFMNAAKGWAVGDVVDCEVLDVKPHTDVFVVKWLPENDFKKNIGKTVQVKVYKNEDGNMDFVTNDKYKAIMPLNNSIYDEELLIVKNAMEVWPYGKIIQCEILDADFNSEQFVVKWLPNKELKSYIGKTLKGKVYIYGYYYKIYLEDQYYAKMPVSRAIYGSSNVLGLVKKAQKDEWTKGKVIQGNFEVLEVDPYEQFVVKWLPNDDLRAYIGMTVPVKVCKNENDELNFLVKGKYKAEMPLKKFVYGNLELVKEEMLSWEDGQVLDCVVLDVEAYTDLFFVKWIPKVDVERLPEADLPDIKLKVVGKIDLDVLNQRTRPPKKSKRQLARERKDRMLHSHDDTEDDDADEPINSEETEI